MIDGDVVDWNGPDGQHMVAPRPVGLPVFCMGGYCPCCPRGIVLEIDTRRGRFRCTSDQEHGIPHAYVTISDDRTALKVHEDGVAVKAA